MITRLTVIESNEGMLLNIYSCNLIPGSFICLSHSCKVSL